MAETRSRKASPDKGYPQRGEIYLAALDPSIGHEIKKTRPAFVVQNDVSNRYSQTTIVAAITSKVSTPPYPNEAILQPESSGLQVVSTVRLDQLRTVDRRRLLKRLGNIDEATMREVDLGKGKGVSLKRAVGEVGESGRRLCHFGEFGVPGPTI